MIFSCAKSAKVLYIIKLSSKIYKIVKLKVQKIRASVI